MLIMLSSHRTCLDPYKEQEQRIVKMSKTTLISMCFDLSTLEDAVQRTRPVDFYINSSVNFLSIPNPLVLFCDKTTRPLLEEIRKQKTDAPTIYIEKSLTEYDFYKMNYPIVKKNREPYNGYINHRNTPSYYILTMFKILALEIVKSRNDFNSTHYAWIDIGYEHVSTKLNSQVVQAMLNDPAPKLRICYIKYRPKEEIQEMRNYVPRGLCGFAAGVFTIEGCYVSRFYSAMMSIFYEMLEKGVGHSEETCIIYCYDRYPELFNIYYGDYPSLLTNYHHIRETFHNIRYFFLNNAFYHGRFDLCRDAVSKIQYSLENELINPLSEEETRYFEDLIHRLKYVP